MMFGPDVDKKILDHAKAHRDEEVCGVIVDGDIVWLQNRSSTPEDSFLIDPMPDNAEAIVHSHPGGPFYPSIVDMKQQYATMLPWGIACFDNWRSEVVWFGDEVPKEPLLDRGFIHGVTDCFSLVRDYYSMVHGVDIMDVPREWNWWSGPDNLYMDSLEKAGFREIPLHEVEPGDGFLAAIRSPKPNHAGIYVGDGLILHHLGAKEGNDPTRKSLIEPATRWMQFITKVVRHENGTIDRTAGKGIW